MDQTQAASSPAEVDVLNAEQVSLAELNRWHATRQDKPAEPAESAPADAPEETVNPETEESEIAPDSDPEETQEQPQKGSGAEKRIKQLLAEKKDLQRKLEAASKPTQTDSSPAKPQPQVPQNYAEYRKAFKPSEWVAEYAKRNPEASYEDANAAMADHLADARDHFRSIEQARDAQVKALETKVNEARERYEDFDEIKSSFLGKVISDKGIPLIPPQVLGIINDSDVLADLLYTIGSDDAEAQKFVEMAKANPNKAIRYVARVESLIAEELAKPKETPVRGEDGKFKAPEPRKTSAPKPPSPVGGGSARGAFDVTDDSLSPDEWVRRRNQQVTARGR